MTPTASAPKLIADVSTAVDGLTVWEFEAWEINGQTGKPTNGQTYKPSNLLLLEMMFDLLALGQVYGIFADIRR